MKIPPDMDDEMTELRRALRRAEAERDHLAAHKRAILDELARLGAPVCDGGQFRADILSAIQKLAREGGKP